MWKRFNLITIILLLVWIALFPVPLQERYHLVTKAFLGLAFIVLLINKRAAIFKLSDFPLWLFLAAIGLNVFFARQMDVALKTYLDLAVPMFFIYYLVAQAFSAESNFNLLVKTISILSILVAAGGIFESLFGFNPLYEHVIENPFYRRYISGFVRPMSTQFNPAPLASFLLGCLPFNFLMFRQNKSWLRLLGAVGLILGCTVIVLTFSRGAFLGLIAMVILYLFAQRRYRALSIFLTIVLIVLLISPLLYYPFSRFGIGSVAGAGGISSMYRLNRIIMTQRIIREHPLAGLGLQHFRMNFYEYYPGKYSIPYEIMIADNMYLTILAETGIIGFLGFLAFIFSLFNKGWRRLGMLQEQPQRSLQLLVILSALAGLLINMGGYEFFYWPNQYLLFCILVGCGETFFVA